MTKRPISAKATASPKVRKQTSPRDLNVYDRRIIMRRAWQLARQAREDAARRAYDLNVRVVGARIIHPRPLSVFLAEIPLDLGAAQRRAWVEAKGVVSLERAAANQLPIALNGGALAPMGRRFSPVLPMLLTAVRWMERQFIPSRAT